MRGKLLFRRRIPRLLILLLILLPHLYISCSEAGNIPYLFLDVQNGYSEGAITIPYSFESESDPQPCRTELKKWYFDEWIVIEEREGYMPASGELSFNLYEGDYTLQFSVLSERAGENHVLTFLDNSYTFTVTR